MTRHDQEQEMTRHDHATRGTRRGRGRRRAGRARGDASRRSVFARVPSCALFALNRRHRRRLARAAAALAAPLWAACCAAPIVTSLQASSTPAHRSEAALASSVVGTSYSLITANGDLLGIDGALDAPPPVTPTSAVVGVAPTADGKGAWAVEANGGVLTYGDATFDGSMAGHSLAAPIVGIAATPTGGGYWEVAGDGGVFSFGDATFHGSMGGHVLARPVVGLAATPTGGGYWEVAADGGVFSFGDATFHGSAADDGRPVAGMALEVEIGSPSQAPPSPLPYENPLRAVAGLVPERIDQGVDYAGHGPVFAVGDGVVLNTTNAGWPGGGFITYVLTDGPAAGHIVYVAENVVPRVAIGQRVTPSTVVGTLIDAYPNLETGWAAPPGNGDTEARATGQWSTYDDTHSIASAFGENFSQLLASLGAPGGVTPAGVSGSLPTGWPIW